MGALGSAMAAQAVPADVQQFLERRAHCDHARGEEAYDEERRQQLLTMLCRYCWHTDRQLSQLRSKYAQDANVIAQLADLENKVEDKDSQALCRKLTRSAAKPQAQ
jgi:hypothetical protein